MEIETPFSNLDVPSANVLTQEQRDKWVIPFYRLSFSRYDPKFVKSLTQLYPDITPEMVQLLLTEYNWRPRLTGSYFAALKDFTSFEDQIGRLLLRSDLCYAGKFYCVALAEFNTPDGLEYLKKYLDYYLTRKDLDYNQREAVGAISYLDAVNQTTHLEAFIPKLKTYTNSWELFLEESRKRFSDEMNALKKYRAEVEG